MQTKIVLLNLVALLLWSHGGRAAVQSSQKDDVGEEYKVYSALLTAEHEADKAKTLVIMRYTSANQLKLPGSDDQKGLAQSLSPLSRETLDNYNARNGEQVELAAKFTFSAKVALVEDKEIQEIFRGHDLRKSWDAFYQKYPDSGGFIRLSCVGFDAARQQALVSVSHSCGSLCGSGVYYLLTKEGGEWKVLKSQLVWIS